MSATPAHAFTHQPDAWEEDWPPEAYEIDDWSWVLAAPFRAHAEALLTRHRLPWRALAVHTRIPESVLRSLLGLEGRRLRRLAPHYALALVRIDQAGFRTTLTEPVPSAWATTAIRALRRLGWSDAELAATAELTRSEVESLANRAVPTIALRTELLLLAAARTHGIRVDVPRHAEAA